MRLTLVIVTIFIALLAAYSFFNNKPHKGISNTKEIVEVEKVLIPRQVLLGDLDKMLVRLSSNGEYISYIAPSNDVLNVWIAPRENPLDARVITNDTERGIRSYAWMEDNEHILYSLDEQGDENFRIYAKNIKTDVVTLLTPEKNVRAVIAGISYKFPNKVMIATNERDNRYFDLYVYDIITGARELIFENNKYDDVITDENFQVRFASLINEQGATEYFQFENGVWSPYMEVSLEDSSNTGIIGFDKTATVIYMKDSRGRDTAALKAVDLKTGQISIVAEDSKSDVDVFSSHPTENNIEAVFTNYEKVKYTILDELIKDDMAYLETVSDGEVNIVSRSLDDNYWIVAIFSDVAPYKYYIYDRQKKEAKYLFSNKKALENYELAKMYPIIIKSRDGLDLVSYISFPTNVKLNDLLQPENPLPVILNVHGGPWVRDNWELDLDHQWLANRGYVVLSVNYRGSTGFGKSFTNAGDMQWGKKMHDDLIDAVNWAIENKIADPSKIAIMGGSYGGYAALAGVTFTPDVFACAVDIVGPSNLVTLLENTPAYWTPYINRLKKIVGPWQTEEDKQALLQVSPITFVDNIKKPLFIAQGANDPRVNQLESDQIVEAMQKKNIPVLYALYQDEGHGFARPENRISYYALAEQFFAEILGGRAEPIGKDLEGSTLILNGEAPKDAAAAEKSITQAIAR